MAMFRRATARRRCPAHFISLLFAAIGATLVYRRRRALRRSAGAAARRHGLAAPAHPSDRGRAGWRWRVALQIANRQVLPRLYVWFHTSLSVWTTLALAVLAARILLGLARHRSARAALAPRLAVLAVLVVALGAGGVWQFRRSQILRFASYERTAIVGLVLHAVPLSLAPQTVAASERAGRRGGAAAAARRPAPPRRRRPAHHHRRAARRSRRRLRLQAADDAEHRRAARRRRRASRTPTPRRRTPRSRWRRC